MKVSSDDVKALRTSESDVPIPMNQFKQKFNSLSDCKNLKNYNKPVQFQTTS